MNAERRQELTVFGLVEEIREGGMGTLDEERRRMFHQIGQARGSQWTLQVR